MDFWLIAVIVVAVVGVGWYLQHLAHKKKVAAFTTYAAQRGWRYTEKNRGLVDRFDGQPFGEGHGRTVRHVLEGTHRDRQAQAFEYSYKETSGSGDNRRTETFYFTVVSLSTPSPRPRLEVTREGLGRKLLGFVGIRDLQLESEEFNRTFLIRGEDDKFAYDILHPRMMEWMLADERALETPFRFERGDLVTWTSGRIELSTVDQHLDYLCDLLERTPSFVWKP
jgi:hypothetical protein